MFPADSVRGTLVPQTPYFASRFEIRKNRGCQANDNDISRKNEAFVPEGFQRASGKPFGGAMGQSPKSQNAKIFFS